MPIYAYSPELALRFRQDHRSKLKRNRSRHRRERQERAVDVKHSELDAQWDRAIGFDRDEKKD